MCNDCFLLIPTRDGHIFLQTNFDFLNAIFEGIFKIAISADLGQSTRDIFHAINA